MQSHESGFFGNQDKFAKGNILSGRKAWLYTALLLLLPAMMLFPPAAFGQAITGTITGSVLDQSGAVVSHADIVVTNTATGISRNVKSDVNGTFIVPELTPGIYSATVTLEGFTQLTIRNINVKIEETTPLSVKLKLGSTNTSVIVSASALSIQTDTSDIGTVIGSKEAEALPLNGRLFEQLVTVVPGAVTAQFGNGDQAEDPAAAGAMTSISASVNGMPWAGEYFMIDGVHDSEPGNGYITSTPPLDAIQEFKVETADPQAEYGSFGGAIINITMKSGTNRLHGEVFDFIRNTALNADNYFAITKPPYHSNQLGALLGGPIIKNKLFFFMDYQQLLLNQGQTYLISVPTQDMRNGILTEPGQTQAYDPSTGLPFPNNTIPQNEINPIAQKVANLFPLPNLPGIFNNYDINEVNTENVPQFDVKLDWQPTAKDHFFARESYSGRAFTSPSPGNIFMMGGPYSNSANHTPVIGWDHFFSQNLLNSLRIGYMRFYLTEFANSYGIDENNIVGIINGNLPKYTNTSGFAQFNVPGYYSTGDPGYVDSEHVTNVYEITDGLTYIRGKHDFKFGEDLQYSQFTDTNPQDDPRGIFNFDGNVTSNQGANNTGNPYASFFIGNPSSVIRDLVIDTPRVLTWYIAPYAQDTWRINNKLTINYGIRWDVFTHPVEAYNKQSNFNLQTGLMQFASGGNRGPNVNTNFENIGPRVGFAYSPNQGNVVIHGAFGMSYFNDVYGADGGTLERNYPFFPITDLETPTPFSPFYSLNTGLPVPQTTPYTSGATFTPPAGTNVFEVGRNFKQDEAQVWNVNVQEQLNRNNMFTLAYVGTHGVHLYRDLQLNQATPGPGNLTDRLPFQQLAPNVVRIDARNGTGSSKYNALQAEYQARYEDGLNFMASYTWSKNTDDVSNILDPYIDSLNTGLSSNDIQNNLVLSYTYELPFGKGKKLLNNSAGATQRLVSGWALNGITTFQGGYPEIVMVASSTLNNNGPGNTPNLTCSSMQYPKTINQWFNTSCFANPPLYTFGNAGTSPIRAPGLDNTDFSIYKDTILQGAKSIRVEADFFNVFNNPHFAPPATTFGAPGFGSITSTSIPNRIIQLSGKLNF